MNQDEKQKRDSRTSLWDEIKEQTIKTKDMDSKARFEYFFEYYKVHFLVVVCVILAIVYTVVTIVNQKDPVLQIALVNNYGTGPSEGADATLSDELATALAINPKKQCISISTDVTYGDTASQSMYSAASAEKLVVLIAAKEIDLMVGETYTVETFAQMESLTDLRTVLTEAELQKLEEQGLLFYTDAATFEDAAGDEYDPTAQDNKNIDHFDKTSMKAPTPVGICLDGNDRICAYDYYSFKEDLTDYQGHKQKIIAAIVVNTQNPDNALTALKHIFANNL